MLSTVDTRLPPNLTNSKLIKAHSGSVYLILLIFASRLNDDQLEVVTVADTNLRGRQVVSTTWHSTNLQYGESGESLICDRHVPCGGYLACSVQEVRLNRDRLARGWLARVACSARLKQRGRASSFPLIIIIPPIVQQLWRHRARFRANGACALARPQRAVIA